MPHPNPVDNGRQATITEPAKPVSPLAKPAACGGVVLASLASRSAAPLSAQEECALKPKDEFKECPTCPVMVVVPSGSFTMGSPASEPERSSDEGPQHQVTIGKAFAVGKFAVTFEERDACVAGGGCNGYRPEDQGWGRGKQPVINVSWNDAKAYIAWLSNKTGKTYRLLSESEWEYTARAGTATPFWWGSSISTSQANYDGDYTYNNGPKGEDRQRTVPVDSFAANPFGLYNVHGNVYQWVEDCYHDSYAGAPVDGTAVTTGDCSRRVLRGGSWYLNPRILRAANRFWLDPDYRNGSDGFRLARTLNP